MSKYALRRIGVWDNEAGFVILPRTPQWEAYRRWYAEGGIPDPLPPWEPPPAPTQAELDAQADIQARANIVATLRAHPLIQQLITQTPQDVDDWIDNQVVDLASAKVALRVLAYVVALLARERLRNGQ